MDKNSDIVVGQTAPDFTLLTTDGGEVTISKLRGKKVVLYFYPKDMTSGCTIQAQEFSAIATEYVKEGVLLFGISPDNIESHIKFIARDSITYPLLADVGHTVADVYGVWLEKSMYGKKYMGIERSTFVIDDKGKLEAIYRKVKPEGHAARVLLDLIK